MLDHIITYHSSNFKQCFNSSHNKTLFRFIGLDKGVATSSCSPKKPKPTLQGRSAEEKKVQSSHKHTRGEILIPLKSMAVLLLHSVRPKLNFICLVFCCSMKLIEKIVVIIPPIHMEAPKWWQANRRESIIKLGSEVSRSQSINFSNSLAHSLWKKSLRHCFN